MGRPPNSDTKQIIFQAAYDLFIEHGYDNTSTAMIAARAGTSTSHPFVYFENKEALLEAVVRRAYDENWATICEIVNSSEGLSHTAFVDLCCDALFRMHDKAVFLIHCALTPKLQALMARVFAENDYTLGDMFAPYLKDLPPKQRDTVAHLLLSVSDSYFIAGDLGRTKEDALAILDKFLA